MRANAPRNAPGVSSENAHVHVTLGNTAGISRMDGIVIRKPCVCVFYVLSVVCLFDSGKWRYHCKLKSQCCPYVCLVGVFGDHCREERRICGVSEWFI